MASVNPTVPAGAAPLFVLPLRPRNRSELDAATALELAVLGAAACRLTPLGKIAEQVRCLTGDAWHPPHETILHTLQAATRAGTILPTESWVRSIPFFYTLTPKGAARFQALMKLPLPVHDDPIGRAVAEVKFGMLDIVAPPERPSIVADLRRYYRECRAAAEPDLRSVPTDRRLLRRTLADRLEWLDRRLDILGALAA